MIPALLFSMTLSLFSFFRVQMPPAAPKTLSVREMSLADRYPEASVNDVFAKNILLTIAYASSMPVDPKHVNWQELKTPATYRLTLQPQETFAFHDDVLAQYQGTVDKTTNAHFVLSEGFLSSGYLAGDGVCHLASLLYWVAKDAGLTVLAPTNHDFREIPGIPPVYGVSIFTIPRIRSTSNQRQNLYIENSREHPVTFLFEVEGEVLRIKAVEIDPENSTS